jgi:hypothetical protein
MASVAYQGFRIFNIHLFDVFTLAEVDDDVYNYLSSKSLIITAQDGTPFMYLHNSVAPAIHR